MNLLTQDIIMIVAAVTADVVSAEITAVSGSFFYYSAVAVLAATDVTAAATTAVSGSSSYYSAVAVLDAATDADATADANFLIYAGI